MTAARDLELFETLKDARPKHARPSQPVAAPRRITPALKAVRFTVALPELGGALELSPHRGFSPIHCKHCGIERENVQESWFDEKTNKVVRWWRPLPCTSCPLDLGVRT